jgi:membrane-bound lytic murein transglycosylase C
MKKTLSYLLIATSLFALNPNNNLKEFLDFKNQTNQEFNNYKKELNEGYKEYVDSLSKGFIQYKKELSTYWKNPELSSKKVFVEYSKDKKIRKKVDYDNNYIEIDVISKNEKEAKAKMAKSLAKLTTETTKEAVNNNPVLKKVDEKLSNNPKLQNVIKKDTPTNEPIVGDIIFTKPPTIKKVINFTTNEVKKNKITKKPSKIKNNFVYTIKIKLPPKGFLAKAKRFKPDVLKRANQFHIKAPFIYSIIHTESSFNPMARSYVPAFGLMQIVPTTAGADAYKMLYGKKKILTPGYLYNSHNNILIGSAYLKPYSRVNKRSVTYNLSSLFIIVFIVPLSMF